MPPPARLASGRGARCGWRAMARPRGCPPRPRRRRSASGAQQRPLPPADHDPRRAPRRRPARRRAGRPARGGRRGADRRIGPGVRATDPAPADLSRLLRLRAARRHDVEAPRHGDPGGLVPAADLLLQQRVARSAARATRSGRRASRSELDYELEVAALVDTPVQRPGRRARRGGDRWLHGPQRLERARPPARGDDGAPRARPRARTSPRPSVRGWSRRTSWPMRGADKGYDLAMTAIVNGQELSRGTWSSAHFSFGQMVERASRRRPAAPRRPPRLRHRRHRLPARDPGRAAEALPRARRHGDAGRSSGSAS